MSISVKNISKIYGEQKALNDISFEINKGEIVGFLGPNGAGKSTMMKILTGYLSLTSGTAEICGLEVSENAQKIKSKIGYLPEHNPLYHDMYIKEYLSFVAKVYGMDNVKERVAKMIEMVGLTPEQSKKIGDLSKGYRQRVGLAQALIHEPEVLILDEPTTGLDPNQIVEIRELIKNVGQDKTVMLSTHIMQEVQAICSRAIIINKGEIVADNSVEQITKNDKDETKVLAVSFEKAMDAKIIEAISGVTKVQAIEGNEYLVEYTIGSNPRKTLMQLSLDNDNGITNLQDKEKSLEELFKELTN
jgi:ABC-2 type transport system ATP-binding protein